MKKKIIAIGLITTMVICNSMTVWADDKWSGNEDSTKYEIGAGTGAGENANTTNNTDSGSKNVTGTYNLEGTQDDTYNVEISWGDMTYTMKTPTGTTKGEWIVDNGTGKGYYQITGFPGWEPSGFNEVTVTNKSNVAITATFTGVIDPSLVGNDYAIDDGSISFDAGAGSTGLFGDDDVLRLESNVGKASVPSGSATASISGASLTKAPTLNNNSGITLGTVTVAIAKQQ